jgi:predicted TIM-barrel fold metal-dependent hydrolase
MFGRRTFLAGALAGGTTLIGRRRAGFALASPASDFIVDAHCHIFNVLDLPIAGFIEAYATGTLHVPILGFLRDIIREFETALIAVARATTAPEQAAAKAAARSVFEKLVAKLPADLSWAKEIGTAIDIATMKNDDIAQRVAKQYGKVDLFVPCLVDFDGWIPQDARLPENDLDHRIAQHEAVARNFMTGQRGAVRFHPFVSFNPRREGALEAVQDAIEHRGFIGVKIYPPCGFSPAGNASLRSLDDGAALDARLEELFGYCEKQAVPILAHTSPGNAFRRGAEFRPSPLTWEDTLEKHPDLRIDLGHFGHDHGVVDGCPNVECLVWSLEIGHLMSQHKYVYADIGDSPLGYDPAYEKRYVPLLNEIFTKYPEAQGRVLYGSDWWMNELESNPEKYYETIQKSLTSNFPNKARDMTGDSALRFLGFRKDDGSINDCNPNWKRLFKYYKSVPGSVLPGWMGGPKYSEPLLCITSGQ